MKAKLLLCLLCLSAFVAPAVAEKYDALPPIFEVSVTAEERKIDDNRAFVYKEYLHSTNQKVNLELREIVDDYDERLSPTLPADPRRNGKRNSRLDIDAVYTRTGESWLSVLVLARVGVDRVQTGVELTTRTYDLESGERVLLTDLFPPESEAWDLLAKGVREHFATLFPQLTHDQAAIDALCARERLEQCDFTLSGVELTLHYRADEVFPGQPTLAHVRFFYPDFAGMMSEEGARQTDNSRWKMVAITCDDGPNYTESNKALTAFRQQGARVTYFIVGKKLVNFSDTFVKEFDQNHLFGCHSYHHWSGYSMRPATRLKELTLTGELTRELVGEEARYFRAPGGTYPPWVEAGLPLPIIQWSLDTYDYTGKAPKKIFYSVRNNVDDGDVILCHDTGKHLNEAVPIFADYLTRNGYMMVTVEELHHRDGLQVLNASEVYDRFDEKRTPQL